MRAGIACDLELLEIVGDAEVSANARAAIGRALEQVAPSVITIEPSPGCYGVLAGGNAGAHLLWVAALLVRPLRNKRTHVAIEARHLPIVTAGLTPVRRRARCGTR